MHQHKILQLYIIICISIALLLILIDHNSQHQTVISGSLQIPTEKITSAVPSETTNPSISPTPTSLPHHVFVIVMENHGYSSIVHNSQAPYINSLLSQAAIADNYTSVAHPSLPNYIGLISGSTFSITSDCTNCYINAANLADQLDQNNISWKAYMDSMPSPCFIGSRYPYAQKHDPFMYFNDIRLNPTRCAKHIVPLNNFNTDIGTNTIPQFTWITPNLCNDMHDCSIAKGDAWLAGIVPTILHTSSYQHGGILFITWDEGSDVALSSDKILTLVLSPTAKQGYYNSQNLNHYSLLRTIEDIFHLGYLNNAQQATSMSNFFTTSF